MRFETTAALLCALILAPVASAGEPPYLGVGLGLMQPSELRQLESAPPVLGLWLGLPMDRYPGWTAEIAAAVAEGQPVDGGEDDRFAQLSLDLLRAWPQAHWTPYVVTGLGAAVERIGGNTQIQPLLGLGAGLRWAPTAGALALRLDLRALAQENSPRNPRASGRRILLDGRASLGLEWHWRPAPPSAPPVEPVSLVAQAPAEPPARVACPAEGWPAPAGDCPADAAILLAAVPFASGSDAIGRAAGEQLDRVASLLREAFPLMRIEIAGHTDDRGSADANRALSARRAHAVKNALAERGVSPGRLVATGYGPSRPLADNATAEGRARNRRVVLRPLGQV